MIIALLLLNLVTLCGAVIAIIHKLNASETKLMSAIKEFADKQAAFNASVEASLNSIVTSNGEEVALIKQLNDTITALQNSAGAVTPEDQALIDQLEAAGQALADKADATAKAAASAAAATPPVPPTA